MALHFWIGAGHPRRDAMEGPLRPRGPKFFPLYPLHHMCARPTGIFLQWKLAEKTMWCTRPRASGRWTNFKVRFFHSNPHRPLEPFTASITPAISTAHAFPLDSHVGFTNGVSRETLPIFGVRPNR